MADATPSENADSSLPGPPRGRLDPGSPESPHHRAFLRAAEAFEKEVRNLPIGGRSPAVQYIRALLAHCVAVSRQVTMPEIDLLRLYHLDAFTEIEEIEDVMATTSETPAFFATVPHIVTVAASTAEDMPVARRLVGLIREMCNAAIASDQVVEPSEAEAVEAYLSLLDQYVATPHV